MKIRESESIMNKKHILALALLAIAAAAIALALSGNRSTDCASISNQVSRDDCYHALAHATGNRGLCNNITDAAEKEHCLNHVAGG